jgi:hypothetical protein
MSWTYEVFLSEEKAVKSSGKKGFRKAPPVRKPSIKALVALMRSAAGSTLKRWTLPHLSGAKRADEAHEGFPVLEMEIRIGKGWRLLQASDTSVKSN